MTSDAFLPCIDKKVHSVVKAGPSCDTLGASSSPLSGNEVLFSTPRQGWNTDALHSAASVHGGADTLKLYLFINRKFIVFFFNSIPPIHPQPSPSRVSFFLLSFIFASRLQECAWNGLIYLFLTFNSHLPQDVLSCLAMSGEGGAGWSDGSSVEVFVWGTSSQKARRTRSSLRSSRRRSQECIRWVCAFLRETHILSYSRQTLFWIDMLLIQ